MKKPVLLIWIAIILVVIGSIIPKGLAEPSKSTTADASESTSSVEFFDAVEQGQVNAKFIALNDHAARLILTNNLKQPLNLKLPEAFAGVPVAAQFGGGRGGGGGGRGGGGGGRSAGGGGQQQSVGGGGGGIGGGGGRGGGGGFFSLPPERTERLDVAVLCLDHGLRDPSSSAPYKIVRPEAVIDRPAVIDLLTAFGRGEMEHAGAQAAAWHLNNDLSWKDLAAKLQGTKRSLRRPPYFTAEQIRAGMSYASAASQQALANAEEHQRRKQELADKDRKAKSSEALSTTDSSSKQSAKASDVPTDNDASLKDEKPH